VNTMNGDFTTWYSLLVLIPVGLVALFVAKSDRRKSFQEFLIPELGKNGFKYVSSEYLKRPHALTLPSSPIFEHDTIIHHASARYAMVEFHGYRTYRTVTFIDPEGGHHQALAAIQFDGFFFRKFEEVLWEPALKTFKKS